MKVIHRISELRDCIAAVKGKQRIGFVPTMGNLHQGHIDLVDAARRESEFVVASIFVNPMQFGAGEDLDKYPRTLDADIEKLTAAGVDLLFAPESSEIYGDSSEKTTCVTVPGLSELWCGASRPTHFDGVATIVNKLFNLVQPDLAVFGEKDFQQLAIIRKMVADLNMPVEILGMPTRRETDGLAMSSRNGYLNTEQRGVAPKLNQILSQLVQQIKQNGVAESVKATEAAIIELTAAGFKIDYLAVCRQADLQPASVGDEALVVLAAVFLGTTRLIDNQQILL